MLRFGSCELAGLGGLKGCLGLAEMILPLLLSYLGSPDLPMCFLQSTLEGDPDPAGS